MENDDKTILVTQPLMPSYDDFCDKLKEVWNNRWFTNNGPFHMEFQCKLKEYFNVENVSLFCNGHLALYTALSVLELSGEVITTPYSFSSTTHAICQCGLTPVFCDINPNDYTIDVNKIEELITDKTSAILAVHVYGNVCDVKEIDRIAKKYNLKVIYDAAHAFGEKIDGRSIAEYGDISMFSFHATKVFNTVEGGAIICHSNEMKQKIDKLRNFGFCSETEIEGIGINGKMDEIRAAFGLLNLRNIDNAILARKKITQRYKDALNDIEGIKFLTFPENTVQNYSHFPIFINEDKYGISRDMLYYKLKENNILSRRYFYPLITSFKPYSDIPSAKPENLPIANNLANSVICLPLYPHLSEEDQNRIINLIINKY